MKKILKKNIERGLYSLSIIKKHLIRFAGLNDNANMIDYYEQSVPNPQTALNIFDGEWMSKLPKEWSSQYHAGPNELFEDPKVAWFIEAIGGVSGKNILELGPMEGAHTYMLEKNGAGSVTAIEANTRAFLKCLIIKEILELNKSRFLCGNFVEYLRNNREKFDIVLASGVLYHMANPAELIELCSRTADTVFIWTHYYDALKISSNKKIAHRFEQGQQAEHRNFRHTLYRHEYDTHLFTNRRFLGGGDHYSSWMTKPDITACLKHFGFSSVEINYDQPDAPSGPCFALAARK